MQRVKGRGRIPVTNSGETEEVRLHLMVSLHSCSSGSNARCESRALEGHPLSKQNSSFTTGYLILDCLSRFFHDPLHLFHAHQAVQLLEALVAQLQLLDHLQLNLGQFQTINQLLDGVELTVALG